MTKNAGGVYESFQEAIEGTMRQAYENLLTEAVDQILNEAQAKLDQRKEVVRTQVRQEAEDLAIKMIRAANLNGITLEIKL